MVIPTIWESGFPGYGQKRGGFGKVWTRFGQGLDRVWTGVGQGLDMLFDPEESVFWRESL